MMRTIRALFGAFLVVCATGVAHASPIIDFSTGHAGAGGVMSFAGSSAPLIGSNIRIGTVTGIDTPDNAGAWNVTGVTSGTAHFGLLDFTTGAYQGYSDSAYQFDGGGTFTIRGYVPSAGITGPAGGPYTLLVNGTFNHASVSNLGQSAFFTATGVNWENPDLLSFFGLAADTQMVFSGFSIGTRRVGAGTPFSTGTFSTDISTAPVPEPASLLLFGSGLSAFGVFMRRRRLVKA